MTTDSTDGKKELLNSVLYNHVQLAYEYANQLADGILEGDTKQFLTQLYQQRLRVLLKNHTERIDFSGTPQADFDDWFRDLRDQMGEFTLEAGLKDLRTTNGNSARFLENSKRFEEAFEGDAPDFDVYGVEAYATYLPLHFFFGGMQFETDWGIYISEDGVLRLAAKLKAVAGRYLDLESVAGDTFVDLAYQTLLRHELEHFKIESFALNAEMISGRALYVPYLINVYAEVYNTIDCLEEALANATVLYSRAIANRMRDRIPRTPKMPSMAYYWRHIVAEAFFRYQPPEYQNFHLDKGPHLKSAPSRIAKRQLAMNYLCNQILSGSRLPDSNIPLYAFPPDNYFLRAEHLVPIHIVSSLTEDDSFIHVATPKRKEWVRFIKRLGYHPVNRGKGDHAVWRGPFGDLTLDFPKKELALSSFKSSLKQFGISMNEYQKFRNTKGLPPSLEENLQQSKKKIPALPDTY